MLTYATEEKVQPGLEFKPGKAADAIRYRVVRILAIDAKEAYVEAEKLTGRYAGNLVTAHIRLVAPEPSAFTVNVSGSERHDGEKPYTYVLEAASMEAAKLAAYRFHLWADYAEYGTQPAVIPVWRPDGPDVVVIDCPEFPCHEGVPAEDCGYRWHDLRQVEETPRLARLTELDYQVEEYREETSW